MTIRGVIAIVCDLCIDQKVAIPLNWLSHSACEGHMEPQALIGGDRCGHSFCHIWSIFTSSFTVKDESRQNFSHVLPNAIHTAAPHQAQTSSESICHISPVQLSKFGLLTARPLTSLTSSQILSQKQNRRPLELPSCWNPFKVFPSTTTPAPKLS